MEEVSTEAKEENSNFFQKLQTEIVTAKKLGHLICIQLDANSKFGRDIIENDPSTNMSENGEILNGIIKSEDLTDKCVGTMIRCFESALVWMLI